MWDTIDVQKQSGKDNTPVALDKPTSGRASRIREPNAIADKPRPIRTDSIDAREDGRLRPPLNSRVCARRSATSSVHWLMGATHSCFGTQDQR